MSKFWKIFISAILIIAIMVGGALGIITKGFRDWDKLEEIKSEIINSSSSDSTDTSNISDSSKTDTSDLSESQKELTSTEEKYQKLVNDYKSLLVLYENREEDLTAIKKQLEEKEQERENAVKEYEELLKTVSNTNDYVIEKIPHYSVTFYNKSNKATCIELFENTIYYDNKDSGISFNKKYNQQLTTEEIADLDDILGTHSIVIFSLTASYTLNIISVKTGGIINVVKDAYSEKIYSYYDDTDFSESPSYTYKMLEKDTIKIEDESAFWNFSIEYSSESVNILFNVLSA